MYLQVLKFTSRREANIKVVCHITPYFISIYSLFWIVNRSLKPVVNILLPKAFAEYQINNISTATLQNSFNFIFPLYSKANINKRNYYKVLQDVTFSVKFFYRAIALFGNPRK